MRTAFSHVTEHSYGTERFTKRSVADSCGVGLGHADDLVDPGGAYTRTCAGGAGGGVGGGDEGVCTVVDVEQSSLSSFEQHRFTFVQSSVQQHGRICHVGTQTVRVPQVGADDLSLAERLPPIDTRQHLVLRFDRPLQFLLQRIGIEQVDDPQPVGAFHFVAIGGADAATGRAYPITALAFFSGLFQRFVVGHDEVGVGAHEQSPLGGDSPLGQLLHLAEQGGRVEHDAVADNALLVGMENAGGYGVEDEDLVLHLYGVTGVGATLEPGYHIGIDGEVVDDFRLALVTPLCPEHNLGRHSDTPLETYSLDPGNVLLRQQFVEHDLGDEAVHVQDSQGAPPHLVPPA